MANIDVTPFCRVHAVTEDSCAAAALPDRREFSAERNSSGGPAPSPPRSPEPGAMVGRFVADRIGAVRPAMHEAVHDHRKLVRLDLRRQPPLQIKGAGARQVVVELRARRAATTALLRTATTERHQERAARADRGRLVRSAIGHVERDLEAKAQVNRRRSHPCHSRSPVIAGSTAGPRRRVCRAVHGDATTLRARCASCASL